MRLMHVARKHHMDACTDTSSARTGGSANKVLLLTAEFNLHSETQNLPDNMQNVELHSFTTEIVWTHTAGQPLTTVLAVVTAKQTSPLWCPMQLCVFFCFFYMQTVQGCKLCFRTSLHSLVKVTSFIGAKRVEGGHDKLPIKGAARQQPLSLLGVARVGVLYKHLLDTQRTHGWALGRKTGWMSTLWLCRVFAADVCFRCAVSSSAATF